MNSNYKQRELDLMSPFKTYMMLLVVVIHSTALWTGKWFGTPAMESHILGSSSLWLGTFCVPAFFFASGYIYSYLKRETKRYINSKFVIKRKAQRLLVPYCFISFVWCAPVWALINGPEEIVQKFVLGASPSQLWFLLALFWVFVIAEALYSLFPHLMQSNKFVLVSSVALYCIGIVLGKLMPMDYWQLASGFQYLIFFQFGYVFRHSNTGSFWKTSPFVFIVADCTLLMLESYCSLIGGGIGHAAAIAFALLTRFAGVLLALSILPRLNALSDRIKGGVLERDSLTVYLFHQQLIWAVLLVINCPGIPPLLVAVLCFVFSLSVSLLIAEVLGRYRLTRYLLGQK